jgi:membrane protein involved in colicin uptake
MGACATKPGDLKVKGEAPLVAEDAAAAPVASEEKAKADGVVPAAAEADPADASRRRSLSDLLKQVSSGFVSFTTASVLKSLTVLSFSCLCFFQMTPPKNITNAAAMD